jgi:hypothetical protein
MAGIRLDEFGLTNFHDSSLPDRSKLENRLDRRESHFRDWRYSGLALSVQECAIE